ncbi:MAG TPA: RHS repeat-associated core domain-containing protein [Limnobacter sp.]|uniref:RHS repeat-associated core domain-containing protein n=1 Tax=Limnobacter sp. TaxID=2003368 RepID=UPI002ED982F9
MFTTLYPVFGQAVKPALGYEFRGNLWLFMDPKTQLTPWLVLHRQSTTDSELDQLLHFGLMKPGSGTSVDCEALRHFGLLPKGHEHGRWWMDHAEETRAALFAGQLVVLKLPLEPATFLRLRNPDSPYWASLSKLQSMAASPEDRERHGAVCEMANILLARWKTADLANLEFQSQSRVRQLLQEAGALAQGTGSAVWGFAEGLFQMVWIPVKLWGKAVIFEWEVLYKLSQGQFEEARKQLADMGMGLYKTKEQLSAVVQEGARLFMLCMGDATIYSAVRAFFDGYKESTGHLAYVRGTTELVVNIGIEVFIALATLGGSLAVTAVRIAERVGPFSRLLLEHLARFARYKSEAKVAAETADAAARSAGKAERLASRETARGAAHETADAAAATTKAEGANTPKVKDTKTTGEPISLINGEELLQLSDAQWPGLIPLTWLRTYRSSLAEAGDGSELGAGWFHPLGHQLRIGPNDIVWHDDEGRRIPFGAIEIGGRCVNTAERITLARRAANRYTLSPAEGTGNTLHFEVHSSNTSTAQLTGIENAFGQVLQVLRNADGHLVMLQEGPWRWAFNTDDQGRITRIAQLPRADHAHAGLNERTLAQYTHGPDGDLLCARDPNGHEEHYRYQQHRLVQRTLKSGYSIHFDWIQLPGETHHRCTSQWGDAVEGQPTYTYCYEWNTEDGSNVSIDSRSGRTACRFNERGQLVYERDPEGGVQRWRYGAHGELLEHINADGALQQWHYNSRGHLVAHTNALGQVHRWERSADGLAMAETDCAGHTHRYQYNAHGQVTRVERPDGTVLSMDHNAQGLPVQATNPLGHTTRWVYDSDGQLQAVVLPNGARQLYRYNAWGQLTSIVQPLGQTTHYAYDLAGQCTRIEAPGGPARQFSYSPLGQIETLLDPQGNATTYEYTHRLGQPTRRINALGQVLNYQYDSERNLVALVNENGQTHQFEYDLCERLVSETGFDGRQTRHHYSKAGLLTHSEENLGDGLVLHTLYERDALGQLRRKVLQQRNAQGDVLVQDVTEFDLGLHGELLSATNAHRRLSWQYDALGRVVHSTQRSPQGEFETQAQYNAAGWLKHMQWGLKGQATHSLQLAYNPLGQVSELHWGEELLTQFGHDELGRETLRQLSNSLQTQRQYDVQGRLQAINTRRRAVGASNDLLSSGSSGEPDSGLLSSRRYNYNNLNQLVGVDETHSGQRWAARYNYDALHRLRSVEGPTPEAFLFDPASNLLEHLHGEEAQQAVAQDALPPPNSPNALRARQVQGNRLKHQGRQRAYRYDAQGNRVFEARGSEEFDYQYNLHRQLVGMERRQQGTVQCTSHYTYDPLGRRASKTVQWENGQRSHVQFYWHGPTLLSEEETRVEEGSEHSHSTQYVFKPGSFEPVAQVCDGQVQHIHTDHLGTPRELSNSQGQWVWKARYRSYGALALKDDAVEEQNPAACKLRFQGQYWDEESGLHYNLNRYYDPENGQFTTQDPIGLAGGLNVYQYAPNPLTWVDPWGLSSKESYGTGGVRPSYLTPAEFAELPKTGMIDPRTIRYSQDSVAAAFKPPYGTVDDFIQDLRVGEINPAAIDPVRIVQRDGKIFTLDNRRLYGFERAGIDIPYQKLDTIPKRELFKFSTMNDGTSITIRKGR